MSKFRFELETGGHSEGDLVCNSLHSECGSVENGLGFEFGKQGAWVISFEDFEKLYHIAKVVRALEREQE